MRGERRAAGGRRRQSRAAVRGRGGLGAEARALLRWQPSQGTVPSRGGGEDGSEPKIGFAAWSGAAGFTRPRALPVAFRYLCAAPWLLPLTEQNIIELEMLFNYFFKKQTLEGQ